MKICIGTTGKLVRHSKNIKDVRIVFGQFIGWYDTQMGNPQRSFLIYHKIELKLSVISKMSEIKSDTPVEVVSKSTSETTTNDERVGYIYVFTFPNGKQYIGQTVRHYEERWKQHKKVSKMPSAREYEHTLYRAIRKHGWDNVLKDVICSCSLSQLNDMEILYIERMKTLSPDGYNMTTGGSQNMIMSNESRKKMSDKAKERFTNPKAILKISDAAKKRFANPEEKKAQSERVISFHKARAIYPVYIYPKLVNGKDRYCIKNHEECKCKLFDSDLHGDDGQIESLVNCLTYLFNIDDVPSQDIPVLVEEKVEILKQQLLDKDNVSAHVRRRRIAVESRPASSIKKKSIIYRRPGIKYPDMSDTENIEELPNQPEQQAEQVPESPVIPKKSTVRRRPGIKYPDIVETTDINSNNSNTDTDIDKKEERPETNVAVGEQVSDDTKLS